MPSRAKTEPRKKGNRHSGVRLESVISHELLLEAVSGISQYAHHARRFTMTDRAIDTFVAETLSTIGGDDQLTAVAVIPMLMRAERIFERARNLYLWSCEAFCKSPKDIGASMIDTHGLDERTLIAEGANRVRERQIRAQEENDARYWEQTILSRLAAISGIALESVDASPFEGDIFGIVHKSLTQIAEGQTVAELVAVAQLLENETLKLANSTVAGNTLTDVPTLKDAVRRSEIFVIEEPTPHTERVI